MTISTTLKTCFRGFLYFLPVFGLAYLLYELNKKNQEWISIIMEKTHLNSVPQIIISVLLSIIVLLLLFYLMGIGSKTRLFVRLSNWIDQELMNNIGVYREFKLSVDYNVKMLSEELLPIFVKFGTVERPGFFISKSEDGRSIVFIPSDVNNMKGSIYMVNGEHVRNSELSIDDFTYAFDKLGLGLK